MVYYVRLFGHSNIYVKKSLDNLKVDSTIIEIIISDIKERKINGFARKTDSQIVQLVTFVNNNLSRPLTESECYMFATISLSCYDKDLYLSFAEQWKNVAKNVSFCDELLSNDEYITQPEEYGLSTYQCNLFPFSISNKYQSNGPVYNTTEDIKEDYLYVKDVITGNVKQVINQKIEMLAPLYDNPIDVPCYGYGWVYFVIDNDIYMTDLYCSHMIKVCSSSEKINAYTLNTTQGCLVYGVDNKLVVCDWINNRKMEYETDNEIILTSIVKMNNDVVSVTTYSNKSSMGFEMPINSYTFNFEENTIEVE